MILIELFGLFMRFCSGVFLVFGWDDTRLSIWCGGGWVPDAAPAFRGCGETIP